MIQSNITTFTDKNVLDSLMDFYLQISQTGIANMIPYGSFLIAVFGIIDLCTTWALYDGQLKMTMMIQKIFKIGCFVFMVTHWSYLVNIIGHSFSFIGYIAGNHNAQEAAAITGSGANNENTLFNPSYILTLCDKVTEPIWESFHNTSAFTQFGALLMHLIALALIYVGFYFMVLQLILTNIEFAIFTCLAVILLPFGCLKYTSFLSQNAISGVFSFGIKLMVLYFLLGIISTLGDAFKAGVTLNSTQDKKAAVDFSYLLKQGLAYLTLGYLTWKIPSMAASMMNGRPSLGDGISPASIVTTPLKTAGAVVGGTAFLAGNVSAKISQAMQATKAASLANMGVPSASSTTGGGPTGGDNPLSSNGVGTSTTGSTDGATFANFGNSDSIDSANAKSGSSQQVAQNVSTQNGDRNNNKPAETAAVEANGAKYSKSTNSPTPFSFQMGKAVGLFGLRFAGNMAKTMGITALMANPVAKGFRRGVASANETQERWEAFTKAAKTDDTLLNTLGRRDPTRDDPTIR